MSADPQQRILYIDASALVKLVLLEPESAAVGALAGTGRLVSSALAMVETFRAVLAAGGDEALKARADTVIATVVLLDMTAQIRRVAAAVEPPLLRTPDAVHLATALSLGAELDAMLVYDRRLSEAAAQAGLTVIAPGRS